MHYIVLKLFKQEPPGVISEEWEKSQIDWWGMWKQRECESSISGMFSVRRPLHREPPGQHGVTTTEEKWCLGIYPLILAMFHQFLFFFFLLFYPLISPQLYETMESENKRNRDIGISSVNFSTHSFLFSGLLILFLEIYIQILYWKEIK